MNKTKPLDQKYSAGADALNHAVKVQNKFKSR